MCGIAGYFGRFQHPHDAPAVLQAMGDAIARRGPDDHGVWVNATFGLGFVHRRLAIVDLSAAGHQPMTSASGQFVLVYNGEIYNHQALRASLEAEGKAPAWRGQSDTETLLAAIEAWGLVTALQRSTGMFALALWDHQARSLQLARDRVGEKPLYAGWQDGMFLFGSDLEALRQHPAFSPEIDRVALGQFLRLGYVPAPLSIYRNIGKVAPGTIMTIDMKGASSQTYWSFLGAAQAGARERFEGSGDEAVTRLATLLGDAVERQMLADVPLGAFLSGGIDSSLIVSLMQSRSVRPVRSFTIGFDDPAFNEATHAKDIARHLGTDHTELILTAQDALRVVDMLPGIYSEPFADVSQIPTYLVAAMARTHVTVALSGDAGDELFAGYNRYVMTDRTWGRLSQIPAPLRKVAGGLARTVPAAVWDGIGGFMPGIKGPGRLSDKIHKAARVIGSGSIDGLYRELIARDSGLPSLVAGGAQIEELALPDTPDHVGVERMMIFDSQGYLPDNVLVKVDRAAMAVSLETRVPMLDHAVVSFALSLPMDYKLRGKRSKWVLRALLERYVPPAMTERPKMGFAVPIGNWLRGPLKGWAEELLNEVALQQQGYLNPVAVRSIWECHQGGREDLSQVLWHILSFQNWLRAVT